MRFDAGSLERHAWYTSSSRMRLAGWRVARRVLVELLRVEQRAAAARERVRLAAALGSSASSRVASRRSTPREKATKSPWRTETARPGRAAHCITWRGTTPVGRVPRTGRTAEGMRAVRAPPPTRRAWHRVSRRQLPAARAVRGQVGIIDAGPTATVERASTVLRGRRAPAAAPAAAARRTRRRRRGRRIGEKRAVARRGARARAQKPRSSCSLPTVSALCGEIGISAAGPAASAGVARAHASQSAATPAAGSAAVRFRYAARREMDAGQETTPISASAESSMRQRWSLL